MWPLLTVTLLGFDGRKVFITIWVIPMMRFEWSSQGCNYFKILWCPCWPLRRLRHSCTFNHLSKFSTKSLMFPQLWPLLLAWRIQTGCCPTWPEMCIFKKRFFYIICCINSWYVLEQSESTIFWLSFSLYYLPSRRCK